MGIVAKQFPVCPDESDSRTGGLDGIDHTIVKTIIEYLANSSCSLIEYIHPVIGSYPQVMIIIFRHTANVVVAKQIGRV